MVGKPFEKSKKPLIMRVPVGVREQPAWIFIGFLCAVSGFGQATDLLESSIRSAIGETGAHIWGTILMMSGILLMHATIMAKPALERLALRVLSSSIIAYGGWLLVVAPLRRAGTAVILIGCLIVVCEVRIWHLKQLLHRVKVIEHELRPRD